MFIKIFLWSLVISFLSGDFIAPAHSNLGFQVNENGKLSDLDKAEIEEFFNLQKLLGDSVWPGFGKADIPVILFNDEWAFLAGYENPPGGWKKVPNMNQRGKCWEPVYNDKIFDRTYYRQRLDSGISPQAFTVQVGTKWVACMTTIEWTRIKLENDIKKNMPAAQNDSLTLKRMVNIMGGNADKHISMVVHEAFHAFQATRNFNRLKESESTFQRYKEYPWNDVPFNKAWKEEIALLIKAFETKNDFDATQAIRQYLEMRSKRYLDSKFTPELIRLEQLKEWEEGIAKYMELSLWKFAGSSSTYVPALMLRNDQSFERYKNFNQAMSLELMNCRMQPQGNDTRFYYSGMMQALLLDRFYPRWKMQAFDRDVFPDMLLARIGE
jgi:hypothetical protein